MDKKAISELMREYGKRGGKACKKKHGREYYVALGRKSGKKRRGVMK